MVKKSIIRMVAVLMLTLPAIAVGDGNRRDIHPSAEQVQPLLPGMQAPAFTVRDVKGHEVSYSGGELDRPLVLTFYRGGWCPYCNLHLSELRHAEQRLREMGFDIWFISIDKPEILLSSLEDPGIGYTILSDSSLDATRSFGLAFRVDDDTNERYLGYGIDLEGASGENHHVLPAPATYIIGANGVINFAHINPDYKMRLHPDVLLAAATVYKKDLDARLVRAYKQRKQE